MQLFPSISTTFRLGESTSHNAAGGGTNAVFVQNKILEKHEYFRVDLKIGSSIAGHIGWVRGNGGAEIKADWGCKQWGKSGRSEMGESERCERGEVRTLEDGKIGKIERLGGGAVGSIDF